MEIKLWEGEGSEWRQHHGKREAEEVGRKTNVWEGSEGLKWRYSYGKEGLKWRYSYGKEGLEWRYSYGKEGLEWRSIHNTVWEYRIISLV